MLSSRPTRTLPPTSAAIATHGSCIRPIENVEKIAPGGSWLTIASRVAAHPGGQVEHGVGAGCPDPLDHPAVENRVARAGAGLRVAHVDMDDGRSRLRRLDRRVRDLLRRDRDTIAPAHGVADPRDGAG